jgi:microcystin-dependent protein
MSISVTKTYQDGQVLYEASLDNIKTAIENYLNVTGVELLAANAVTTLAITDASVTRAKIAATERTPVAAVMGFAGSSAPTGWLICDGSTVSRTTYADLFAIIGVTHGEGNGTTTFHLPDYRGRFLRGVDSSQGRDPNAASRTAMNTGGNTGDNVGSIQGAAFKDHTHTSTLNNQTIFDTTTGTNQNFNYQIVSSTGFTNTITSGTASTGGGDETRPLNANVNFIIKY